MILKGRAIKYGDDINTDLIIPGKYLHLKNPKELAVHAMENLDPGFIKRIQPGDIIVAGRSFGCGSSREQAAICLHYAGVGAIVAKSFARIFYRNAINQGISIIESFEAVDRIKTGDTTIIDFAKKILMNETNHFTISIKPPPPFLQDIIEDGGIIAHLKKRKSR